jgi:hypothetical protein
MRHVLMMAVLLPLAGCAGMDPGNAGVESRAVAEGAPFSETLDGWTVTSWKPRYVDDTHIVGRFTFDGDGGTRGGGACLVADLSNSYPCETVQDCWDAVPSGAVVPPAPGSGGFLYCEAAAREEKLCWTRPTGAGCSRAPDRVPGTYQTTPAVARVAGRAVRWIQVACLAAEGEPTGCAGGGHIYARSFPLVPEDDAD